MTRINDLPKKERKLALKRMEQQRGFSDENELLMSAFAWEQTKEGQKYWDSLENTPAEEQFAYFFKALGGIDVDSLQVNEPEEVKPDPIVESVVNQLRDRSVVGIRKYGTTLNDNNISTLEWIEHAKQEAMDFILYLERLKKDLNA
jgi:hypothetical protein